jgi:hypothetical protein
MHFRQLLRTIVQAYHDTNDELRLEVVTLQQNDIIRPAAIRPAATNDRNAARAAVHIQIGKESTFLTFTWGDAQYSLFQKS